MKRETVALNAERRGNCELLAAVSTGEPLCEHKMGVYLKCAVLEFNVLRRELVTYVDGLT